MHTPVLLNEVLEILKPKKGGIYIDATFGGGGYTKAIISIAECTVHAIDRDENTQSFHHEINRQFPGRSFFYLGNFGDMEKLIPQNIAPDGIVFDIGVSTMQLKIPNRGFSFADDGPLDMRMSEEIRINAGDIVNSFSEKKIADIIYNFSDERKSRKIAKAIVDKRHKKLIKTTTELADIVRSCFAKRYYKIDPATKTFQALRIFVNNELEELQNGLRAALDIVSSSGIVIVVSFHALEDRIVKNIFRSLDGDGFQVVNKKVIVPAQEELDQNISARSAKLRAIKKV